MSTFISTRVAGPRARLALLLLGSLAGLLAAGVAGATTSDNDPPSVVVKYGDLALDTDSGVNQLYRRIQFAAKRVCPDFSFQNLAARRQVEECWNQSVARAIRQIGNPRLAALHAARSKTG